MIVPMSKIAVAGIKKEKSEMLKFLSKCGCVQISSNDSQDGAFLEKISDEISENEKKLLKTKSAINILKEFDETKKPMFTDKISVNEEEFFNDSDKVFSDVSDVVRNNEKLEYLKAQIPKFENEKARLLPYSSWNIPPSTKKSDKMRFELGYFPKDFFEEEFFKETEALFVTSKKLFENNDGKYYGFIIHKDSYPEFSELLKKYAFSKMTDTDSDVLIGESIKILDLRIGNTKKKIEHYESNLKKYTESLNNIKKYHDSLETRVELMRADFETVTTNCAFVIEGYLPTSMADTMKDKLESMFFCVVKITEIEDGEDFPVEISNGNLIKPFEVVTEMYSIPSPHGIDPSKVMAPFYFIFFGMMLSDAGYGLLLTLITAIILFKFKPQEGQFKKMCSLMCICGISTFIFGIIFGSFFSDLISTLTLGKVTQAALINPMDDPMTVLIAGYILGAVHILTGLGVKAYMLIRNNKVKDAIFDIGSWYLVFIGIAVMLFSKAGIYIILAGVIMLILTQGRNEKNIFKKLLKGVLSLYDITGYLADILSYSRLLALGLSTAVVGMVINKMGAMGASDGWTVSSAIIFTLVFLVGHTFNIAINVLGAYVHTCRLMYIEFFNKFFEGGGKRFKPLKIKNKYTKL